ncbi:hypothetical protein PYW08_009213 [Mythimna loreyi]|uniref:Uncharacterized protein n=1 Tax=Mythimna loreyi TaxID=667449 RepID=A0ACC2Q9T0_9NEOP|nr:hypothetical protein PYW08_009213 [Mythimna loreyi]
MATSQNFITLGELFSRNQEEEEEELLAKVKGIIEDSLPMGWQDWKVIDWSKEELLGRKMDHRVLNKIRFAIPSVELVKAFYPEAKAIGEKAYKNMKLKLLDWDICRALITNPNHIAAKLRGSSAQAEIFKRAVETIKASVYSREQISDALTSDVESHKNRMRSYSRSNSEGNPTRRIRRKRPRLPSSSSDEDPNLSASDRVYSLSPEINPPKRRRYSPSPSPSPKETTTDSRLDRMEGMIQNLYEMICSKNNDNDLDNSSWRAPSPVLDLPNEDSNENNINWDIFSPSTKESEPAIPRANPILEQQGLKCQRLGESTWNKIRYADSQKKLQASPVFHCLRINTTMYQHSHPNQLKDVLGKCDSAFGTITHGLLVQRLKLQEALKKVAEQHPEATESLKKMLASESEFRSISDDLLQYTCGKRAEVIESRRKLYEPKNNFYRSVLNDIPPSGTHLWDEDKLQEAIKTHGVAKIAPAPRRILSNYTYNEKENKPKQPRDINSFRKPHQGVKKFRKPESKQRPQKPQSSKDHKRHNFKERGGGDRRRYL